MEGILNIALFREFVRELTRAAGALARDKPISGGLTLSQCHVLLDIGDRELRHKDLAASLGVDPSTLTRNLDGMEKKGLIKRELNTKNRRELLISLTEKGSAALTQVNFEMDKYFSCILKEIPNEKIDEIEESVRILLQVFKRKKYRIESTDDRKNGAE